MALYFTGASLVFGILLNAFIKDSSTPKTDVTSWLVLIIATLLWPIVLPGIIRKKLRKPAPLQPTYGNPYPKEWSPITEALE
jgi:uncharacterized membrane protein